jgi:hypothetical protein
MRVSHEWLVSTEMKGRRMNFRTLALAAVAASVAMTAATTGAGAATATGSRKAVSPTRAAGPSMARQVVLVDGESALVLGRGGGAEAALLAPGGTAPAGVSVELGADGRTYDVPLDALPFFGRGLDPNLFDAAALAGRESGGKIPVQIHYRGPAAPDLPGVAISAPNRGPAGDIRTAAGYLTASSAKEFGAALARQYVADRNRASYGTDGMFADGVSVSLAGDPDAPTASPQSTKHTLTITGTNLSGKPDTGDVVLVFNVDNGLLDSAIATQVFAHGIAKVSVPAGHYMAIAAYITLAPGGDPLDVTDAHLDVLPQFTVTANTTVQTSAEAATSSSRRRPVQARPTSTSSATPIPPGPSRRRPTTCGRRAWLP